MSITKRANGWYTAQIYDPAKKKRVSLGTFERRRDAQAAIDGARDAISHGESLTPYTKGSISFTRFVEDVFLESPLLRISPETRGHYKTTCNRLTEYFGDKPLNSITQADVLAFNRYFETTTDRRTGAVTPRSANYRRKAAQILRQVFNIAVESDYIPANAHPYKPELRANQLPARPKESLKVRLTHKAADQILSILNTMSQDPSDECARAEAEYWYYFLGTALHSGLRMSEICGLRVSDLDSGAKAIDVSRQWGWDSKTTDENKLFPYPKSRYSSRSVPMSGHTFDTLWEWAAVMRHNSTPYDLVFPRPNPERGANPDNGWGKWGSRSDFSKKYKAMLWRVWVYYLNNVATKPGVKMPFSEEEMIVGIHQWRHLYCVICLAEAGIDVNTVSRWMGHHSAAFTYQVYSRYVPSVLGANLKRLDKAFAHERQVTLH